jgi:hypothetical protein
MKLNKIEVRDRGSEVIIQTQNGPYFLRKENIKIKAHSKNKRTLCWYYHPIYKELTYVEYRMVDGRPEFYLTAEELIDFDALKKFVDSNEFKNKRYAFMNYDLFEKLAAA